MGEEKREEEFDEMKLFELTMGREWTKVVEIYSKHPTARTTLLTKSKETALHIAISSFHSKSPRANYDATSIKQMMDMLEKEVLLEVLEMANERGDTLLHLAAAVGSDDICERVANNYRILRKAINSRGETPLFGLMRKRNKRGETPLFVAAHHGNLRAFLSLHNTYAATITDPQQTYEPLRRPKDGDTILHSAISGEYFRLAFQIMSYYPLLIDCVNANGESPLHILARKPNAFKSSTHLRLYDSIIFNCVFVDKLKEQKYVSKATRSSHSFKQNLPGNYMTCGDMLSLLWNLILLITGLGSSNKEYAGNSNDEENQQKKLNKEYAGNSNDEENQQKKLQSFRSMSNTESGVSINDHEENQPKKPTSMVILKENQPKKPTNQRESNNVIRGGFFPANYATCILQFKFAMKIVLIILGIGFGRIKKIKDKKERYQHAMDIMNKMIDHETRYRYDSSGGQQPDKKSETSIDIDPNNPPVTNDDHEVDHQNGPHQDSETCISTTSTTKPQSEKENNKKQNKSAEDERPKVKETPLLVAAKMGILEMVKKILMEFPVAIQDIDSKGKNALMVAAEYRQSSVFDYLMRENVPEYMFHQLDNHKNGILHLAAKLEKAQPWRIPGAALQMQWEIKWYKHVKQSVSDFNLSHENAKSETPRMIFSKTHEDLVKAGNQWLIKTSESCSVIAALIAGVAFATSATVPGGLHQDKGYPNLKDHKAFDVFSIASLIALCLSITALVFFLAIITSRCEARDFKSNLPKKLLIGLSSLFASIAAMLLSFCAGHTFILRDKLRLAAVPIYAFATIPVGFFAMAQLPLYFDLLWASYRKVPLRSYKVFYQ